MRYISLSELGFYYGFGIHEIVSLHLNFDQSANCAAIDPDIRFPCSHYALH